MGSSRVTTIALGGEDSYYYMNDNGQTISHHLPKELGDALIEEVLLTRSKVAAYK